MLVDLPAAPRGNVAPPMDEPIRLQGAPLEVRPVENPLVDRLASGVVTAAPPAILAVAAGFGGGGGVHRQDLGVLAVSYQLFGFGVTVGFHRLFTHRSFKTSRALRVLFAVLGSAAVEGPGVGGGG